MRLQRKIKKKKRKSRRNKRRRKKRKLLKMNPHQNHQPINQPKMKIQKVLSSKLWIRQEDLKCFSS